MKIAFNKKLVRGPYGGGNNILASLVSFLKKNNVVTFDLEDDIDVIVIMDVKDSSCCFSLDWIKNFKNSHKNIQILHRINDNTIHRENSSINVDDMIIAANRNLATKTVYISKYLFNYFFNKGLDISKAIIIGNGADRSLFKYYESQRKEHEPLKIITHHWSNNLMKGYRVYDNLNNYCLKNPNIANFTFMGNCPSGFLKNAVKIPPQPYDKIPLYLQKFDVYVTASLYEPGGCHIVEGMSCGLIPLVAENTGGCLEYSGGYNMVFRNETELFERIEYLYKNFDFFCEKRNNMANFTYGSDEMCKKYLEVLKDMLL